MCVTAYIGNAVGMRKKCLGYVCARIITSTACLLLLYIHTRCPFAGTFEAHCCCVVPRKYRGVIAEARLSSCKQEPPLPFSAIILLTNFRAPTPHLLPKKPDLCHHLQAQYSAIGSRLPNAAHGRARTLTTAKKRQIRSKWVSKIW